MLNNWCNFKVFLVRLLELVLRLGFDRQTGRINEVLGILHRIHADDFIEGISALVQLKILNLMIAKWGGKWARAGESFGLASGIHETYHIG